MDETQIMRDVMRELDAETPHPTLRPFVEHIVDIVVNHLYEADALENRLCPSCETQALACPSCEPEIAHGCEACLNLLTCSVCGTGDE